MLLLASRAAALISGLLLCYAGLFLYEDEEREVQNAIELLWIRIDDWRKRSIAAHLAFTRVSASTASRWLARLFGKRLGSIEAISVSICLSLASLGLVEMFVLREVSRAMNASGGHANFSFDPFSVRGALFMSGMMTHSYLRSDLIPQAWAGTIMAAIAATAVAGRLVSDKLRLLPTLVAGLFVLCFAAIPPPPVPGMPSGVIVLSCIVVSTLCDIAAIAAVRHQLRRQCTAKSSRDLVVPAVIQALLVLILLIGPSSGGLLLTRFGVVRPLGDGIMTASGSNLFASGAAALFFAAALVLLLHSLIWPLISRPLYRLARIGVLRNAATRTAMVALGAALITFALGGANNLMERIVELLRSA